MKNNKSINFLLKSAKGYKRKLITFSACLIFTFQIAPTLINPYIYLLVANSYEAETLNITKVIIFSLIFALSMNLEHLFRFLFVDKYLWYGGVIKIEDKLRKNLFNYTIKHSISYYDEKMSGVISEKIKNVSTKIGTITHIFSSLLGSFVVFIVSSLVYFTINKYLVLIFFTWMILFFFLYYFYSKSSYILRKNLTEEESKMNGVINDSISNILNIKSFANSKYEKEQIEKQGQEVLNKFMKDIKNERFFRFAFSSLTIIFISAFLGVAYYLTFLGEIKLGTFVFLCQNIILFRHTLGRIYMDTKEFFLNLAVIKDGLETILEDVGIEDKKDAKKLNIKTGKIVFKNITFDYK